MHSIVKRTSTILLVLLILFLTMGVISASENVSDSFSLENSNVCDDSCNVSESFSGIMSYDSVSDDNSSMPNFEGTGKNVISSSKSEDNLSLSNELNPVKSKTPVASNRIVYKSVIVYPHSVTKEYTSGFISFPVKFYDAVNCGGITYKYPKYNSLVKLRVYSGNTFKNFYGRVGNDGIANVGMSGLSMGYHKVLIYIGGKYRGLSYIKVIKSTTTVYAPVKFVKYGQTGYFNVKWLTATMFLSRMSC